MINNKNKKKKIIIASATGLTVAALTGGNLYALFNQTGIETGYAQAGTLVLSNNSNSEAYNISNAYPGQSYTFLETINNQGNISSDSIDVAVKAEGSLANNPKPAKTWEEIDPKTGEKITVVGKADSPLMINMQFCSVPWVGSGNSYSCSTGAKNIITGNAEQVNATRYSTLTANNLLPPKGAGYLKINATVPNDAGAEYAGESAKLSFKLTATQRSGKILAAN